MTRSPTVGMYWSRFVSGGGTRKWRDAYAAAVVLDPDGIFAGVGAELAGDGGGDGVRWDMA